MLFLKLIVEQDKLIFQIAFCMNFIVYVEKIQYIKNNILLRLTKKMTLAFQKNINMRLI
jgi:hypothetical protein